jgi:hypothetical protein
MQLLRRKILKKLLLQELTQSEETLIQFLKLMEKMKDMDLDLAELLVEKFTLMTIKIDLGCHSDL